MRTLDEILTAKVEYSKKMQKGRVKKKLNTYEEVRRDAWSFKQFATAENAFMQDILILNKRYAKDFYYEVAT